MRKHAAGTELCTFTTMYREQTGHDNHRGGENILASHSNAFQMRSNT